MYTTEISFLAFIYSCLKTFIDFKANSFLGGKNNELKLAFYKFPKLKNKPNDTPSKVYGLKPLHMCL